MSGKLSRPLAVLVCAALAAVSVAGCGDDHEPDPKRGQQWGLDALRMPAAWNTARGDDTVIAVVDTGVDLDHPDLKSRLVRGTDMVDGDGNPEDHNGHGTHVAGIAAAATDNGVGIAGGAPGAKIMPVRVLTAAGSGDKEDITRGVVWAAEHGADVINLSLGETGLMAKLLRGGTLNRAIATAHDEGAVVVAAAGNEGTETQPYRLTTPVLVVGASDQHGRPASFSNFGAQGAVTAPGVDILSTLPTYTTPLTRDNTSGYGKLDGTSMATPYVSAVAALLHQQGRTPDQIITDLKETARNPQQLSKLGLGIVDAQAAVARGTPPA
ncbi:S8 family serine peptidase [Streptomyces purpurogeneiscleroticus]|uniref:S8 family serine peptidase n=1 Tax=Streptomyces purpurogeneiscleroticus TaxID=68259 RepID=UPI001CBC0847|nr:S8 family serine peptidase [Streptomyces purpurogeneiscleroticus]MBZ4017455.1 thermophilic serine proteinase precursor [Streptomyces purpurogeneiscleroticus]